MLAENRVLSDQSQDFFAFGPGAASRRSFNIFVLGYFPRWH